MSTVEEGGGSDCTLCPSDRSENVFRLIRPVKSFSSERSSTTKFVKYINPAAYIERNIEAAMQDFSDSDEMSTLDDIENIEYEDEHPQDARITICRIQENNERQQERQRKYEEWLRNKRRIAFERHLRMKAMEEREQRNLQLKNQISREKVMEWMSKKSNSSVKSNQSETEGSSNKVKTLLVKKKSDKELNFEAWLKKKEKQEILALERQKHEEHIQAQNEDYRKLLANAFYNKWMHLSHGKPRPVPLNQGFASLAGSTSNLYVNPQPWNHI
ncbi:uncharacterized protein LOC134837827 [Culicoides brevitarsis]|uniref:uncharacterized protein LOC134837827 n=1 Tax=Culicoides brevitarsis TaxID=469753 RepID=UPI00307B6ABA